MRFRFVLSYGLRFHVSWTAASLHSSGRTSVAALFTRLREHLDSLVVRMDFEQGEEPMSADTYHIIHPDGVAVRGIEEAAGIPPSAQGSLRSAFTRRKITQGTGRSHGLRSASAGRKIPHPAEVRRVSG